MAGSNHPTGGFSYAQAARGQSSTSASQPVSSKTTSGTASPSMGSWSEIPTPKSNWADDVEAVVSPKSEEASKAQEEGQDIPQTTEESPVEQVKAEEVKVNGTSGLSSPDLAASPSTTTNTKDDFEVLSPPNGSLSESTWEVVSQASDPAWIADRKERQSASQAKQKEKSSKEERGSKDVGVQTVPTMLVLQEAPPPTVNPWLKRAEEAKAKATTTATKPTLAAASASNTPATEQEPTRVDPRRKANSIASIPTEPSAAVNGEQRRQAPSQARRSEERRSKPSQQSSDQDFGSSGSGTPVSGPGKIAPATRQSLPNISSTQPVVSDASSWPTPETAQEQERKDVSERDSEEKREDDTTPAVKRKKQEWKILPVTPSIKFETVMNESKMKPRSATNGERGGRGGTGSRGRGGSRGIPGGASFGERGLSRPDSSPPNHDAESKVAQNGRLDISSGESTLVKPQASGVHPGTAQNKETDAYTGRHTTISGAGRAALSNDIQSESSTNKTAKPQARQLENVAPNPAQDAVLPADAVLSEEFVPEPIPQRKVSGSNQLTEGFEPTSRESGTSKASAFEYRKDVRPFESVRDTPINGIRGGRRGGRGRGNNALRDLPNGHVTNHAFPGSHGSDFMVPSPYAMSFNASPYQMPRAHQQAGYPNAARGGWNHRGNLRSQSIPIDGNYYQRPGQYPTTAHHLSIQTYNPGPIDQNGVPLSAMPYPGQMDPMYVIQMVVTQLDYYFSVDNLLKDMFLRKHMDSQGFVFMDVVASFNRVRQLTQDKDIIRMSCMYSDIIEIRTGEDGKERLRKADGWDQFLLPLEQREETAQNAGPQHLQRLDRPRMQFGGQGSSFRGSPSTEMPSMQHGRADRRSYDGYAQMNGMSSRHGAYNGIPEVMFGDLNGEEMRGRAAKSPVHDTSPATLSQPVDAAVEVADLEPDTFPNEQIAALTVVVKVQGQEPGRPIHNLSSRTFSNGSIDPRVIMNEIDRAGDSTLQTKKEGSAIANGVETKLPAIPIVRRPSPNKPRSNDRAPNASDLDVFWVKDQQDPVGVLPGGLTSEVYVELRSKALDQREHASTGNCPYDMDMLYQFWAHFLIRNFNNRMYTEFMTLANEDARQRHSNVGMQNLIRFYDQSFRSQHTVRVRVAKDYVRLVRSAPSEVQGLAFKTLRTAWRDGALPLKNRKRAQDLEIVDEKLKGMLEGTET